jgi:cell envelope opacity-associated protein A
MDEATGSKLSMLKEGQRVRAEVNEDNQVVDIYATH